MRSLFLKKCRDYSKNMKNYMAMVENQILAAFPPQVTPEEMNHWDIYTLLDYYVRSNHILEIKSKVQLFVPDKNMVQS